MNNANEYAYLHMFIYTDYLYAKRKNVSLTWWYCVKYKEVNNKC